MSDYRLGKKIEAPTIPKGETIEHLGNGIIRRNGKLETIRPLPPTIDPYQHLLDVLRRSQQAQEDDGFPVAFWGTM